jgi:hypothetical protein
VARTCREGGPQTTGPGFSRTGNGSPTRPVSAVPRARRRVIPKTTTEGVSRFVSQTQPREQTNRRLKPLVTTIHHDQRTNTSSLPDLCGSGWPVSLGVLSDLCARVTRWGLLVRYLRFESCQAHFVVTTTPPRSCLSGRKFAAAEPLIISTTGRCVCTRRAGDIANT